MFNSCKISRPPTVRRGRLINISFGWLRDKRGSTAVEFAVGIPIAFSAIFGTIEVGRLGFTQAALQYAAEESTRYAIVRMGELSTQDIENYAATKLDGVFDRQIAVVTATAPIDPATGTSTLSVSVNYVYQFMLPFLPASGINLSGNSRGFIAFPPALP